MGFMRVGRLWKDGVIPFTFDTTGADLEWRAVAHAAMLDWSAKTEILFVPRTDEADYIEFRFDPTAGNCRSPVGCEGGKRTLLCRLKNWNVLTHELGHAIGFIHEHQRPDRNAWVEVDPEAAKADPYNILPVKAGFDELVGGYDCNSVNHYPEDAFISPRVNGCLGIGTVSGASLDDVVATRAAYGAVAASGLVHQHSAISRGPNQLDVFVRWVDNRIHTATWPGTWKGWWTIGKPIQVPSDGSGLAVSPATVISQTQPTVDVFIRGRNNDAYITSWDGADWSTWRRVGSPSDRFLSAIGAVSRLPGTIDLFVRGFDNGVYTTASHDGGATWKAWWRIGTAVSSSDVAVVARKPDALNIFVLGVNNGIYAARWQQGQPWQAWQRVLDGVARFGTGIAAVSREPQTLDLFIVGADLGIYSAASHDGGATWKGWWRIRDGVAAPGTRVTAVSRTPSTLDIFAVGRDRRVWTATWDASRPGGWEGWDPVLALRLAERSGLSAVSRDPGKIDLFAIGEDGRSWTAARDGATWKGWWPVAEASEKAAAAEYSYTSRS